MNYYAIDRMYMQTVPAIYVPMSIVHEQDWPESDIDALTHILDGLAEQSTDGLTITLSGFRISRLAHETDITDLWGYILLTKAILLDLITPMPSARFIAFHGREGLLNYTPAAKRRAGGVV